MSSKKEGALVEAPTHTENIKLPPAYQTLTEEARKIVDTKRDYSGWRRYMAGECNVSDDCTSPMCPLDIRLNPKEVEDAKLCCEIQGCKQVKLANALTSFVRKYCACYENGEPSCIGEYRTGTCLIMQAKPCGYFKRAVFPICDPSYKFATETGKYEKLLRLYKKIDPNIVETDEQIRKCSCGQPLKPRRRYCEKCTARRRRDSLQQGFIIIF